MGGRMSVWLECICRREQLESRGSVTDGSRGCPEQQPGREIRRCRQATTRGYTRNEPVEEEEDEDGRDDNEDGVEEKEDEDRVEDEWARRSAREARQNGLEGLGRSDEHTLWKILNLSTCIEL